MPTSAQHRTKAENNEFFADELDNPFWDWAVTGKFYAAVQYVEAYLAKKAPAVHSPSHEFRDNQIQRDAALRPIYPDYRELKNESRDARYDASLTFAQADVARLEQNLDNIKKVILPLL